MTFHDFFQIFFGAIGIQIEKGIKSIDFKNIFVNPPGGGKVPHNDVS